MFKALSKNGIEISVPLLTVNGQYFLEIDGKIYCLYRALPGKVFNQHFDSDYLKRAYLYGKSIALLHDGLKEVNLHQLIPEMNLKEEIDNCVVPTIVKEIDDDMTLFQSIISDINQNFFSIINTLPIQIIHRDAHPGNIVINEHQVSGFIDFDITRKGIRLFDLCYCSTSILMSNFNDSNCRQKWLKILGELIKGYTNINPLTENESKSIVYIIFSIQLIFAAYFYDLGNKEVAKYNLEGLYWINKNKLVIQEELSTIT